MKISSASVKILAVCYVCILAAIIFVADTKSTRYLLNFIGNVPYGDKIGHFCLMGTFSLMLNLALNARTFQVWKLRYLSGTLIVIIVVTLEEFSQLFIRGRSFDLTDLTADFLGIVIFGEIARVICRRFIKD